MIPAVVKNVPNTLLGAMYIVPAMFVIGMIDNFVIYIARESSVWQFHFFRSLLGCTLIAGFFLMKGISFRPRRPLIVVIRSFLLASSMMLYFGSLALMPIAQAGAGLFSAPIFILAFSVIFFRTRVGLVRIIAVTVGFTGVLLVLRPDFADFNVTTIFPVFAALLYAGGQLITRHYCSDERTTVILLGFFGMIGLFGLVGVVLTTAINIPPEAVERAPFFLKAWQPPNGTFFFWTSVQAIGSLVAVAGLIRGYQVAEPTLVTIFEYSFLIFAGFWGWIIWNHVPDLLGTLGIALIISSGVVITVRSLPKAAP